MMDTEMIKKQLEGAIQFSETVTKSKVVFLGIDQARELLEALTDKNNERR